MNSKTPISRRTLAKSIGLGAGIAAGATLLGGIAAPAIVRAQAKTTLKLGHLANEENVWHKASLVVAEEVAKRVNQRSI